MEQNQAQDVAVMAQVAAGDSSAFAQLFDAHSSSVLGMLVNLVRRRELAEEILQETFLQAWNQATKYSAKRATPRGWLLMLARSRALDHLRSSTSRTRREERTVEDPTVMRTAEPVGTRELESAERRRVVLAALAELPDAQRRCLELAFYEGLTQSQIAAELQQPLGTVKSRVLSAMKKVREAVGPYYQP